MYEIKLKSKTYNIYDSIHEMPIIKLKEFEKCLGVISNVGDSMQSLDNHYSKLYIFANNDKKDELLQEINNIRQNWFFIFEKFSVESLAFTYLIDEKREIENKDLSIEILKNGITDELVQNTIDSVKKKYIPSLN